MHQFYSSVAIVYSTQVQDCPASISMQSASGVIGSRWKPQFPSYNANTPHKGKLMCVMPEPVAQFHKLLNSQRGVVQY